MKKLLFVTIGIVAMLLSSCGSITPKTFIKASDGGSWSTILLREDLSYDVAFNEVLDVVAKRFEMDMISKDGGYARTNWIYTWNANGIYSEYYRTRVTFKFSPDRTRIDIKTEAQYRKDLDSPWISGFDTQLLSSIKQDVGGVVGRTTL